MTVPALALLDHAKAAGLTLEAGSDGRLLVTPRSRLTPELRAALVEHKATLVAALAGPRPLAPPGRPPVPAAVALRVAAFRNQLAAWTGSGRLGVPLLALPDLPRIERGRCVGCGDGLLSGRTWRCAACVAAVEAMLGMPPVRFDLEPAP